jgi:hypothetical protein
LKIPTTYPHPSLRDTFSHFVGEGKKTENHEGILIEIIFAINERGLTE